METPTPEAAIQVAILFFFLKYLSKIRKDDTVDIAMPKPEKIEEI